jgi:hypothetical protein
MNKPEWLEESVFIQVKSLIAQETQNPKYVNSMARLINESFEAREVWERIKKIKVVNYIQLVRFLSGVLKDCYSAPKINKRNDIAKYTKIKTKALELAQLLENDYLNSIFVIFQTAKDEVVSHEEMCIEGFNNLLPLLKTHNNKHLEITNILKVLSDQSDLLIKESQKSELYGNSLKAFLIRRLNEYFFHLTNRKQVVLIAQLVSLLLNTEVYRNEIYKIIK